VSWPEALKEAVLENNDAVDRSTGLSPKTAYAGDGANYEKCVRNYLAKENPHLMAAYYPPDDAVLPERVAGMFYKFKEGDRVLADSTGLKPSLRGAFPKISESRTKIWEEGQIRSVFSKCICKRVELTAPIFRKGTGKWSRRRGASPPCTASSWTTGRRGRSSSRGSSPPEAVWQRFTTFTTTDAFLREVTRIYAGTDRGSRTPEIPRP